MINYRKSWIDYFTLIVAIVISLILIARNGDAFRNSAIHTITLEITSTLASPFTFWHDILGVRKENQRLKQRNIQLQLENSRLYQDRLEKNRLMKLLDLREDFGFKSIPARVVGLDGMMGIHSFILDKGKKDGVKINMPVIATQGLAGKVIQLSEHNSVVQAVTDKNFRVAARLQDERFSGILKGTGGDKAELWGIPLSANVNVDDKLITLGMDSIYPPYLQLGKVLQVKDGPEGLFYVIKVEPAEIYSRIEQVLILARMDSTNENSNF